MTSSDLTKIGSIWNNYVIEMSSWNLVLNYTLYNSNQTDTKVSKDKIVLWHSSHNEIDAEYILDYHLGGQELPNFEGFLISVESNTRVTEVKFVDQIRSKQCQIIESNGMSNESLLALKYHDGNLFVNHTSKGGSFCIIIVEDLNVKVGYFFGITASSRVTERTFDVNSFKFFARGMEYQQIPITTAVSDVFSSDDQVISEAASPDSNILVYGLMIVVTILVLAILVIGVVLVQTFSSTTRESTSQPLPELVRLSSLRAEENERNSVQVYKRASSENYYVSQRTPSGNYHIYEKPRDFVPKQRSNNEYDHLNFYR